MASLCQRVARPYMLKKISSIRAVSRRTLLSTGNGSIKNFVSSSVDNGCLLSRVTTPSTTQMRFYQPHDVYAPSPRAPRPGRPDYEERMWKALNTFDRFPKDKKLSLDTHFTNDLGLDSLDHVELIVALEAEFNCEIPDDVAEKLMTPKHMLDYLCEKDKVPEKRTEFGEIQFKF